MTDSINNSGQSHDNDERITRLERQFKERIDNDPEAKEKLRQAFAKLRDLITSNVIPVEIPVRSVPLKVPGFNVSEFTTPLVDFLRESQGLNDPGYGIYSTVQGRLGDEAVLKFIEESPVPLFKGLEVSLAVEIVGAESQDQRDRILSNRAVDIAECCENAIHYATDEDENSISLFLNSCVEDIKLGRHPSAQALATNIMDTLVSGMANELELRESKAQGVSKRLKDDIKGLSQDLFFFWLPFARAYADNKRNKPTLASGYSRHESAHKVSATQYVLHNSVLATMLATAAYLRVAKDMPNFLAELSATPTD